MDKDLRRKISVPNTLWWPFHCAIILTRDNITGMPYLWWHTGLLFTGRWIASVGLDGLQIIWAQKREQSEFYFNSFYFWIYFPAAGRWWLPQQSSQLLSVGLDYVWTQSLILSKTQLMRREMKSALSHSVFVVICDTFTPLTSLFIPPSSMQVL